ncbi:hypothetical protein CAC42_3652 [Sphaceloma murrayae]|uniref:Uncharacterized protein n=1 Tax=Sphaceloma murrayae TaxID=2082308 RepID=A0A2K1QPX7_9PEZI|nr:hypothetical protein CAC42_3652 [Sphaceloma murrayae]
MSASEKLYSGLSAAAIRNNARIEWQPSIVDALIRECGQAGITNSGTCSPDQLRQVQRRIDFVHDDAVVDGKLAKKIKDKIYRLAKEGHLTNACDDEELQRTSGHTPYPLDFDDREDDGTVNTSRSPKRQAAVLNLRRAASTGRLFPEDELSEDSSSLSHVHLPHPSSFVGELGTSHRGTASETSNQAIATEASNHVNLFPKSSTQGHYQIAVKPLDTSPESVVVSSRVSRPQMTSRGKEGRTPSKGPVVCGFEDESILSQLVTYAEMKEKKDALTSQEKQLVADIEEMEGLLADLRMA